MNAVDYLKVKGRMTNNCNIDCDKCPLETDFSRINGCAYFESEYPEQAVEIVEKWAKENPVKTYLSVLLEKLPSARLNERGCPTACIRNYFGELPYVNCGFVDCIDCWNREYKEEK